MSEPIAHKRVTDRHYKPQLMFLFQMFEAPLMKSKHEIPQMLALKIDYLLFKYPKEHLCG